METEWHGLELISPYHVMQAAVSDSLEKKCSQSSFIKIYLWCSPKLYGITDIKILESKNNVAFNLLFPRYTLPSSNFMASLCFQEIIIKKNSPEWT